KIDNENLRLMRVSAIGNKEYKELIKIKALFEEKFNHLNSEINTLIVNLKQALQSAATSHMKKKLEYEKEIKILEILVENLKNVYYKRFKKNLEEIEKENEVNDYKFPSKAEKKMEIIAEILENLEQKILIP
ncbi:33342_t:CDS:2, partial [Racocetra persica]